MTNRYALRFSVDYPGPRPRPGEHRLSHLHRHTDRDRPGHAERGLRPDGDGAGSTTIVFGGAGLLFLPPLLMLVFREKYPRWWLDWNGELLRFTNRVGAYLALLSDR